MPEDSGASRSPKSSRCAIYTRKSSEEGLEQEFNSLHAQREACEAYIQSQRHEGWQALSTTYDDGGWSGGSMERPALKSLLADIKVGLIDVVVVYKIDRLTRSLFDFAKIVEVFDAHQVSFVSVTQSFNTTTSMGRLTLNVLLSFAQFEREVTGERIRDKIAASRRKGMWTGGNVPLGYDLVNHKLVVNEGEAEHVRRIFNLYLEMESATRVLEILIHEGVRTKRRISGKGRELGGYPFSRGPLYYLLRNPLYIGKVRHKADLHDGEHAAIVAQGVWDQVQTILEKNAQAHRVRHAARHLNLLSGLVFHADGRRLTPTHSRKKDKAYRYYASMKTDADDAPSVRIPASDLETIVEHSLTDLLRNERRIIEEVRPASRSFADTADLLAKSRDLASQLEDALPSDRRVLLLDMIERVVVGEEGVTIKVTHDALARLVGIEVPTDNSEARLIILTTNTVPAQVARGRKMLVGASSSREPHLDESLLKAVVRAYRWARELIDGSVPSIAAVARREGLQRTYVSRHLPLAFLAPDIVTTILAGEQPPGLTVDRLLDGPKLPLDWQAQRQALRMA